MTKTRWLKCHSNFIAQKYETKRSEFLSIVTLHILLSLKVLNHIFNNTSFYKNHNRLFSPTSFAYDISVPGIKIWRKGWSLGFNNNKITRKLQTCFDSGSWLKWGKRNITHAPSTVWSGIQSSIRYVLESMISGQFTADMRHLTPSVVKLKFWGKNFFISGRKGRSTPL
jgi:hypothetical protein